MLVTTVLSLSLLAPGDVHVDASAPCAGADGSPAAPFCTLAEGVAAAAPGDTIHVAPGRYHEAVLVDRDLTIRGPAAGARAELQFPAGSMAQSVVSVPSGTALHLEDVDFVDSYMGGSPVPVRGALLDVEGSLVLRNSTIAGNRTRKDLIVARGAAANLLVDECVVRDNELGDFDRALRATEVAGFEVRGSLFLDNVGYFYRAGGIAWSVTGAAGEALVVDTSVIGNGLAVAVGTGGSVLRNCTVTGNQEQGVYAFGGLLIDGCTIIENSYTSVAEAAVVNRSGAATRVRSSILGGGPLGDASVKIGYGGVGFSSLGGNVIEDRGAVTDFVDGVLGDQVGSAASPLDARLAPPAVDRGTTPTMMPLGDSPAIDRGVAGGPASARDQNGRLRVPGGIEAGAAERPVSAAVGTCPSVPNSTGSAATLEAVGSDLASRDALVLDMAQLPSGTLGAFITSRSTGVFPQAGGSLGTLCLGGSIGRFFGAGQILGSGAQGRITLRVGLTAIPQGNGVVAVLAGETWYFQGWFRDVVGGQAASNFSESVGVTFQ